MKYITLVLLFALYLAVDPFQGAFNKIEYYEVGAWTHPNKNSCISISLGDYEVKVVFGEIEGDAIGQWNPSIDTIYLEDYGVDTVSHEVHHMVDDAYQTFNMGDDHLKAYMQGFYTGCVMEIVERYERANSDFNFSSDLIPNS